VRAATILASLSSTKRIEQRSNSRLRSGGAAQLTQVSTSITDYLLAAFTLPLGILLLARAGLAGRLWGCGLLASALAAFAGGTWHGFQLAFPESALFLIWKAVMYLSGVFGLAAASGTILATTSGRLRGMLLAAMIAIALVYAALVTTHDQFIYVIAFNMVAMAVVFVLHMRTGFSRHDPASPWMIAGIAVSATGGIVQASGLSLDEYFNNNVLFHVIQMVGTYLLFRGAWLLGEGRRST